MSGLKSVLIVSGAILLTILTSCGMLVGGTALFVRGTLHSIEQGEKVPLNHADLDVGSNYGPGERQALIAGCAKSLRPRMRAVTEEFCECVADAAHDLSSRVDRLHLTRHFTEGADMASLRFNSTLKKLGMSGTEIQRILSQSVQRGQNVAALCASRVRS